MVQGKLKSELTVAQTTLTKDSRHAKVRANSGQTTLTKDSRQAKVRANSGPNYIN